MNSPVALLTRSRSGALTARAPLLLPCESCPDAALCDGTFPCPNSDPIPEEDSMLECFYFSEGESLPHDINFSTVEELLNWSREWPKRSVYPYDETQHYYRAGEEHLLKATA